MSLDIALYQPDIANNTGTLVRLGACMGLKVHIIHPSGFPITPQNLARSGLDYVEHAVIQQHDSFEAFDAWRVQESRRLILLTTKSSQSAYEVSFASGDILMLGRESAGVPDLWRHEAICAYASPCDPVCARSMLRSPAA